MGDVSEGDLVSSHLPWAQRVISSRWGRSIQAHDYDDMQQEAAIGLMRAAETFDQQRGVLFRTWARRRILGATMDCLRAHRGRYYQRRLVQLGHDADRSAAGCEPATEQQVAGIRWRVLLRLWREMPIRTARMAVMHYFDGASLRLAGQALGVTESRACQLLRGLRELVEDTVRSEIHEATP